MSPHRRITGVFAFFAALTVTALCAAQESKQDRYALAAPNGISFSIVRGYEDWKVVAPSYRTDKNEIRFILGNETVIRAYRDGVPENGKPFPDGSMLVKVAHTERKNAAFPAAIEPDTLQRIEFMVRDAKKYEKTNGWGYARFVYDAKTGSFTPYGKDASFDKECDLCHTLVRNRGFVFTHYPSR